MSFDFLEKLLNHGLEHIVEEILALLPLEDVLCRVVLVNRYVNIRLTPMTRNDRVMLITDFTMKHQAMNF